MEPLALLAQHGARGMRGVGQLAGGVEKRAAAEVLATGELPEHLEQPKQTGPAIGRRDALLDSGYPRLGLPLEICPDQIVLRAVVGVERRFRRPRPGEDPVDARRTDPFRVEETAGRVENPPLDALGRAGTLRRASTSFHSGHLDSIDQSVYFSNVIDRTVCL